VSVGNEAPPCFSRWFRSRIVGREGVEPSRCSARNAGAASSAWDTGISLDEVTERYDLKQT
jgi:hypothetical protein